MKLLTVDSMQRIINSIRVAARGLAEVIAPDYCRICGGHLAEGERLICNLCRIHLPATDFHLIKDNAMTERFAGESGIERAMALFYYVRDTPLALAIHDFKYNGIPSLAMEFGREMGRRLMPTGFLSDIDVVVPVPIHFLKKMKRGYNQTEYIARGLAEVAGLPIASNLYARRPHKTQTGRALLQRQANTNGVFAVRHPEELASRHVLLIDDVCTTGSTLKACVHALRVAQPSIRCSIATLAAAPRL